MITNILPIGTIIQLKSQTQKLMIVGHAQLFEQKGVLGYFDYSAVIYPYGVTAADSFAFFNQEDIGEVIFEGYFDESEAEFLNGYQEKLSKVKYPKLHIKAN